ncbi:histidine kinase [Pseudoflavitalea sp. G-6-1-2]|uniref:sensor histidine kinase n=1 Tax=Pseudoflavitalea sp. G-6-1-2 TaxID=2728841 RepID=UPI00146C95EC|nr:sensor histidine kinase [Pseudoflavitalea sp. G-6-1-2]NML21264.1 histidine kinase [Pseudoflavitalea sp. G-6-1-2]
MNLWYRIRETMATQFETILYIGAYCWMAILNLPLAKGMYWHYFGTQLLQEMLAMAPVLYFSLNRARWKQRLTPKKYRLCWIIFFPVYLSLLMAIVPFLLRDHNQIAQLIVQAALFSIILELALSLNTYLMQRKTKLRWYRTLSLEKALLLSIACISVILAVMAVNSEGNPEYDKHGILLLGFEFNLLKVFTHFGTFFSFLLQLFFMYCCGYFYFLLNNRILVPKVLKTKGTVMYVLAAFAVVGISYPLITQLLNWLPINQRFGYIFPPNPFQLENASGALAILFISLPIVMAIHWNKQSTRITTLEKEKAETELDLLKQQLNPHFFFNTLNNLYALSLTGSSQTPESILRLSDLMRYVIYKAKDPLVPVQSELTYIEDYIQLQQIRLKRKPDIRFEQHIEPDAASIAPLLLIVLVENAFKHGIEPAEDAAWLEMKLTATASRLHFTCSNSFEEAGESSHGIGLENLRRRLQLLYPEKHKLSIQNNDHIFKAELELQLI